jgi:alpha-beta hydrolase superfamily lysophospholipase
MGAEEQIASDPSESLAAYRAGDPDAETKLIAGAGHSPNVEKPAETAALVLRFGVESASKKASTRHEMQDPVQKKQVVRGRP